ncbi:hypothetical protein AGABI2DRAFT_118999 [Agaricus bisporus var. bisporus H97]|uniref:hypothetical protein n=1 Tax=Agaricus bisporus var. bisporus (strain H97 / ATCC MYA-4626 / FGSC 10389) TaxID=936046 RepID=UPI00029F70D6|nr:hypothetical protein AGABI2DRAFT_118999 [Agaricus bisporus var. bisporus H97]EKV46819.1 hypothetical protein AGABI2DRAFT_118999 [Agaricus bisporus var. bisporus H97]
MPRRANSIVLTSRTSSLTLRIRGQAPVPPQQNCIVVSPRVPLEVIERIIELVQSACLCQLDAPPSRSAIGSIIQASKALRGIAMRVYFRDVVVDSPSHFLELWTSLAIEKEVFGMVRSFNWVKAFFGSSQVIMRDVRNIGAFANLQTLDICFASEGLKTQDLIITLLFRSFDQSSARTNLKSLSFMNVPRIDTKLFGLIAKTFPRLTELELTSTSRIDTDCCLGCLEDSLECTRFSPIPDHHSNAEILAESFATSLAPLEHLEDLYLGIYLSDASLLEEHLTHADGDLGGRDFITCLPYCHMCKDLLRGMRERETLVSKTLASNLSSLVKIRWDTLFLPPVTKKEECDAGGHYFDEEERVILSRMPYAAVFIFAKTNGEAKLVREWRFW